VTGETGHRLRGDYSRMRPDYTVDQDWEAYARDEHDLWRRLYRRQESLISRYACPEFIEILERLDFGAGIPRFDVINGKLAKATNWQLVAVPGLLPDLTFFEHLANRRFPAGQFIRKPGQLDYIEEPDVFHDVFGHVPMLMHPAMADYIQAYGKGGLRAQKLGVLPNLARVYWYTVEFGLVESPEGVRIYGSGIASSYTESVFALEDGSPNRIGFELERVMSTRYRIDDFQETYFVIRSIDELLELARIDFAPIYAAVRGQPELEPGQILPQDRVLQRGSGAYHARKRNAVH